MTEAALGSAVSECHVSPRRGSLLLGAREVEEAGARVPGWRNPPTICTHTYTHLPPPLPKNSPGAPDPPVETGALVSGPFP